MAEAPRRISTRLAKEAQRAERNETNPDSFLCVLRVSVVDLAFVLGALRVLGLLRAGMSMPLKLTAASKLLFIGDSITDCGRRTMPSKSATATSGLIRDFLAARTRDPVVINRGISGDKIPRPGRAWHRDVIDAAAGRAVDLIGINDVWHGLRREPRAARSMTTRRLPLDPGTDAHALPACRLVLCEPSVIWPPAPAEGNEKLKPYIRCPQSGEGVRGRVRGAAARGVQ